MSDKVARLNQTVDLLKIVGRMRQYYHPINGWVTAKWPRKRGPSKLPIVQMQNAQFADVQQWIKIQPPEIVIATAPLVAGTGWMLRDVLMSCAYGRFWSGYDNNGTFWQGLLVAKSQIQSLLDSLTTTPFGIITRLTDGWAVLLPGKPGQVLTTQGDATAPDWTDVQGGGGAAGVGIYATIQPSSDDGSHTASNGNIVTPQAAVTMYSAAATIRGNAGGEYQLGIAPFDPTSGQMTDVPVYCLAQTLATDIDYMTIGGSFAAPFLMDAGQSYIIFVKRFDGSPTTQGRLYYTADLPQTPWIGMNLDAGTTVNLASVDPQLSDVWSLSGDFYSIAMGYGLTPLV
uniref:Uncharacterized protein n=1 Tax=uncultured prokaryote TaxID=198431 RepID=A0A0H5Q1T7_9ZZZZ|nr:hypothetical protein [uncultured prokaryote]